MCARLRRIKLPRIEQLSNDGYPMGEQVGPTQVIIKGEGNLEWTVEEEEDEYQLQDRDQLQKCEV